MVEVDRQASKPLTSLASMLRHNPTKAENVEIISGQHLTSSTGYRTRILHPASCILKIPG